MCSKIVLDCAFKYGDIYKILYSKDFKKIYIINEIRFFFY